MEKKKPHYNLEQIKHLIRLNQVRITYKASEMAEVDFGLTEKSIIKQVLDISIFDFYKSMTSHSNYKIWQDVYHKPINAKAAYIKLQIVNETTVIIQFKEK